MVTPNDNIDAFLDNLLASKRATLQGLFDQKLAELQMLPTEAYKLMGLQSRTAKGILTGSQTVVDMRNIVKLANFLQIPKEQAFELYLKVVSPQLPTGGTSAEEILFIKKNFNLAALRKAGLIDNMTDFDHIKQRIMGRLGLRTIREYKPPTIDVAFSEGVARPDTNQIRAFWIMTAQATLSEINNPNLYDREALMRLFGRLGWYSTNVSRGLMEVSKLLFQVGVTVIYQPPLPTLQLRGATFSHNRKPCIVLTDYRGFYATLWWALIHELFHVLFDWEEIQENRYHLTDDANKQLSVQEREEQADNFAREYLFSKAKSAQIRPYINDEAYVRRFADEHHVHPSIIYVFNAFDASPTNKSAWPRAKHFSPSLDDCHKPVAMEWKDIRTVDVAVPELATSLL